MLCRIGSRENLKWDWTAEFFFLLKIWKSPDAATSSQHVSGFQWFRASSLGECLFQHVGFNKSEEDKWATRNVIKNLNLWAQLISWSYQCGFGLSLILLSQGSKYLGLPARDTFRTQPVWLPPTLSASSLTQETLKLINCFNTTIPFSLTLNFSSQFNLKALLVPIRVHPSPLS